MGGPCSVRGGNPLKGFVDAVDAVWRFTLAIAGRDPSPLLELDDELSFTMAGTLEEKKEQASPPASPYNLRPRQPVNYRV